MQSAQKSAEQVKAQRLAALERANQLRAMILARRNGEPLSDSAEWIKQMREEQVRLYEDVISYGATLSV